MFGRPAPKPKKEERVEATQERKLGLSAYRRVQSALAIERDNNLCVFCWFLKGTKTPRAEIHHVYSRGKSAGDWREHHTNLLCTCRECHPPPIITGGSPELDYVEQVREMANTTPINRRFKGEN